MTSSLSSRITEPSSPPSRGWGAALCAPLRCRSGSPTRRGFLKGLRWDRGAEPPQKHKAVHSVETLLLPRDSPYLKASASLRGCPCPSINVQMLLPLLPHRSGVGCRAQLPLPRAKLPCMSPMAIKGSFCRATCVPPLLSSRYGAGSATPLSEQGRPSGGGRIQASLWAEGGGCVPSSEGILPYPRAAAARPDREPDLWRQSLTGAGWAVLQSDGGGGESGVSPRRAVGCQGWAAAPAAPSPRGPGAAPKPPHTAAQRRACPPTQLPPHPTAPRSPHSACAPRPAQRRTAASAPPALFFPLPPSFKHGPADWLPALTLRHSASGRWSVLRGRRALLNRI